jgi:hypothetical protein
MQICSLFQVEPFAVAEFVGVSMYVRLSAGARSNLRWKELEQ